MFAMFLGLEMFMGGIMKVFAKVRRVLTINVYVVSFMNRLL